MITHDVTRRVKLEFVDVKTPHMQVLNAEAFSEPCKNVFMHKSVFTEEFGRDMVKALDNLPGYTTRTPHFDRPGYNVT